MQPKALAKCRSLESDEKNVKASDLPSHQGQPFSHLINNTFKHIESFWRIMVSFIQNDSRSDRGNRTHRQTTKLSLLLIKLWRNYIKSLMI